MRETVMMRSNKKKEILKKRKIAALTKLLMCLTAIMLVCSGFVVNASAPQNTYKYYTNLKVARGETLWDIAHEHMTDDYDSVNDYINEVRQLNSIIDDSIYYGQQLVIPYYSAEEK